MLKRNRKALTVIIGLLVLWVVVGTIYWTGKYAGMQQSPAPQTTTAPVPAPKHPNVQELFTDVNNERVKAGEQPLVEDPRLDASAAAKCADMVRLNEWAHDLSDGTTPLYFVKQSVGTSRSFIYGENIAYNPAYQFNSQDTVNSWMASPEHKANILKINYTLVGYAICSTPTYPDMVVQHFVAL